MSWPVVTAVVMKKRGEPREMARTTAKRVKRWNVPPAEQKYRTEATTVKKSTFDRRRSKRSVYI
jgi:hypothetical protein